MLQHLKHNYVFYILFLLFILLARFDITWQNKFLTEYYRLPFFTLAVITSIFIFAFSFKNARLCNTQSLNYRKLSLVTIGYSGYEIIAAFMARDPSKAQLLVYVIILFLGILFYFHRDSRLNLDEDSPEFDKAYLGERKYVNWVIYPALAIVFVLQNLFYLYVNFAFEIYFNPLLQIAFGISLANAALILSRTRLDNLKHFLLIIETLFLILALGFYLYLFVSKLHFLSDDALISNKLVLTYIFTFIAIAIINLSLAFTKAWKGFSGFFIKLSTNLLYLSFFLISYRVLYF
ncbi:hypothetical protein CJP74_06780 [Psittacicella melopsittaci]|uniref:Uncharacterized protein n=1 Tax=Psittacicella melopsittaci TaxID=2028576 RepID=A0A3A1Y3A9_9GAMM|nr:hypothetical protein [Psittacicella melopsittaci]RIY31698.1 hypothetical protein CJP74_06780 [Psittacicella melopsittaci]